MHAAAPAALVPGLCRSASCGAGHAATLGDRGGGGSNAEGLPSPIFLARGRSCPLSLLVRGCFALLPSGARVWDVTGMLRGAQQLATLKEIGTAASEAVHKASPIPRDEASTKAERLALPREAQITRALPLGFLHQLDRAAFFTDVLQDRSNFDSPAQLVLQDLFSEQCGKAPARTASY